MRTFAILLCCLICACAGDEDIRDYYYPVRELTEGLVYEYENTGNFDPAPYEYWYYLGIDQDSALYLSSTRYADGMTPVQVATERVRNDGVYLQKLTVYPPDTGGIRQQTEADILYDRTFPFYPADERATGYRVRFTPPGNPDAENYVSLNRYYRGDTTLEVMGETYEGVVFDLQGEVSLRDLREGDISPTFSGYEIYARDIGLVEYRRDLGAGGVAGGKLVRRIDMAEFIAAPKQ
ncbi:hypothetical protein CLV84_0862 [Neolewinella xylanilytica]|uniref:Uncharacterized protein n=1 Tax=Neolewinella xylanilytica TaxID=1514080 RepID=A0A2S6I8U0_9BACT|nr:hypothetical protein [Neolewinella xylanilytica]PPK87903.1 hypothetical protein CLV84_0862 [Neolewinella xylanilytica]